MKTRTKQNQTTPTRTVAIAILFALGIYSFADAATVTLQQATATYSQPGYSVATAINGTLADNLGWAIDNGGTVAQTAVFETSSDIGFASGSTLTFTIYQTHGIDFVFHTLGRFRLSVTTDLRSQFADGLATGGDVTANWTVLDPSSFLSANGATLTKLGDLSLLASGTSPQTDIYSVTATTTLTGITGIRLEALEDPSLPFNGPGRQPLNGNFVLSEFVVDISPVPEPTIAAFLVAGSLVWLGLHRGHGPKRG